jgi:CBS domain-containing protein
MLVQDVMTQNPACCGPNATLQELARTMADCDCGEIPIVEKGNSGKLIGVVTDRDIACRAIAEGRDPQRTLAQDVMSSPVVSVTPEMDLEDCCRKMEDNQIRRVPVVDANGACCGIVAQADIARRAPAEETGEVVRDISRPTLRASRTTRA